MLNLPNFAETTLADDVLVGEVPFLQRVPLLLLLGFLQVMFLGDVDEIVYNWLVHETLDHIVLIID